MIVLKIFNSLIGNVFFLYTGLKISSYLPLKKISSHFLSLQTVIHVGLKATSNKRAGFESSSERGSENVSSTSVYIYFFLG